MMEKFLPTGVVSISQLPALPRSAMSKRTSSESDPESSSASGVLSDTKKQKGESLILFQSMIAEKDEKIQKLVKTKKNIAADCSTPTSENFQVGRRIETRESC